LIVYLGLRAFDLDDQQGSTVGVTSMGKILTGPDAQGIHEFDGDR